MLQAQNFQFSFFRYKITFVQKDYMPIDFPTKKPK